MLIDARHTIGQRVKIYRKHRGLSQDELAESICSRQTISILENDQHIPSADTLQKIASRLGIPLREIMADKFGELDDKIQIDMIKVYIEIGDYQTALPLIEELEEKDSLLDYQKRQLVIPRAECLIKTNQAERAVTFLLEIQEQIEKELETDIVFKAVLHDKLGTAYFFLSNIANAYAYYMRAYQFSLQFPIFDLVAAQITYNLGMSCRLMNQHADSITYLSKAESFFKKIADTKRVAQVLFQMGIAYRAHHDLKRADQLFQESLALLLCISNFIIFVVGSSVRAALPTRSLNVIEYSNDKSPIIGNIVAEKNGVYYISSSTCELIIVKSDLVIVRPYTSK